MAWNEPGKNGKDKDPWGQRGGREQGPPDLDDFLKDVFDKFGGLFGGGSGRGGNSSSSGKGLVALLFILITVWAISGFYTVREAERAIVLRFGSYIDLVDPGLNWKPTFIDKVILVDVKTINSLRSSGDMLTQDENVVLVDFEIQYRVTDPHKFKFSVTDAGDSLRQATDSALRYVIGHSEMTDILTAGREVIRQRTWEELEKVIAPYNMGIELVDVNFKDARPPEAVKASFDDAISAQEDEERFIREAEAYAREIEPQARGQVKRIEQEANAYQQRVILEAQGEIAKFEKLLPEYTAAPEVTRQRLYLETMEEVYSNTSKVLVNVKGGNNMMYLPLDKIMQNQNMTAPVQTIRGDVKSLRDSLNSSSQNSEPSTLRESSRRGRGE